MEKSRKGTAVGKPDYPALAARAERSIVDGNIENKEPGFCQGFAREVVTLEAGSQYAPPRGTSAHDAIAWYKAKGWTVPVSRGSVPGDLLYKSNRLSGTYGHVGIRVPGNRVAENSTANYNRTGRARGYRSLEEFGEYDCIVRIPHV